MVCRWARLSSRTAEPDQRSGEDDPGPNFPRVLIVGPRLSRHSTSKTRVNALMALGRDDSR